MKEFFAEVWSYIRTYIAQILCAGIALRQLIIGDWFGAIIAVVVGIVLFLFDLFK
jgi:hypothetical protein